MIRLVKSTFYKEKETVNKLCKFISSASQLSMGEQCIKFERAFSKWQGRKYCVMVNSGSSANLAVVQALLNLGKIKIMAVYNTGINYTKETYTSD